LQVFVDLMMAQELRLAPPDAASPLLLFAATAGAFLAAGLAPLAAACASTWGVPAQLPTSQLLLRQLAAAAIAAALVLAGLHVATLGASQRGGVVVAGALRALGAVTAAGAAAAAVGGTSAAAAATAVAS